MWYFRSPQVAFGPDALSRLDEVQGRSVFIVTDEIIAGMGFIEEVAQRMRRNGLEVHSFHQVEREPSVGTVERIAAAMRAAAPDWIIGLGGGSCLDAAKAAWFLYERPDLTLSAINPVEIFGLRRKARLITIPTTAGSGAEVSQAALIYDPAEGRKVEMVSYEMVADITIVDPLLTARKPAGLTADAGIDVLCHALEGYNNALANDFSDGLALQAVRLVFQYLERAVKHGENDPEARTHMANAATISGLVICNANIALAHALGHSAGGSLHLPHARVTAIFLPGTVEFNANGGAGRYTDVAAALRLPFDSEHAAGLQVAGAVRGLIQRIGLPGSLAEAGVPAERFAAGLDGLCDHAEMDLGLACALRIPNRDELRRLFEYAYSGRQVDF